MKIKHLIFNLIIVILILICGIAKAQSLTGPSDVTTSPPTATTDVNSILCYGQNISINGPQDPTGVDYTVYHWYKVDGNGNKTLTSVTTKLYTETTTTAGYYNYQLITENATGCTSDASDEFKIYVLPLLTPAITAANTSVCSSNNGSSLLTATVTSASGYSLAYQWTRNGVNIQGAVSSTYNISGETVAATITYGVIVTYVLRPTCSVTATTNILVIPPPQKPVITAS